MNLVDEVQAVTGSSCGCGSRYKAAIRRQSPPTGLFSSWGMHTCRLSEIDFERTVGDICGRFLGASSGSVVRNDK